MFSHVMVGSNDVERSKPFPDIFEAALAQLPGVSPDEAVVIGDTPADMECGRSLGVRAIGVATGSYTVDELLRCGAHAAFETLADTKRVVHAIVDA